MEKNGNKPAAKHSNLLLTKEKGLGVLDLDLMVLPLSVYTVILEHVGLQKQNHTQEPYNKINHLEYLHYQFIECTNRNSNADQSKRDLQDTPTPDVGAITPATLELKSNPNHRFVINFYTNSSIGAANSRSTLENRLCKLHIIIILILIQILDHIVGRARHK